MGEQNDLMRDEFIQTRRDQRAIIAITNPQIQKPVAGEPLQFSIGLVNAGKTPAIIDFSAADAVVSTNSGGIDHILKAHARAMETPNRRTYLPVGQVFTFHATIGLDKHLVPIIEHKTGVLFVVITARYDDGVGAEHAVAFCFRYDADSGELQNDSDRGYIDDWTSYKPGR